MNLEELSAQIERAYRELAEAAEELAQAQLLYERKVRDLRVTHAEELIECKNERTANLYLDGILERDREFFDLEGRKAKSELDHQLARREVERLHLLVRLMSAPIPGAAGVSS